MHNFSKRRSGVTLLELMVVISISRRLAYRMNFGVEPVGTIGRIQDSDRMFGRNKSSDVRLTSVSDGLSNTIAFSERIPNDNLRTFPSAIVSTDLATSFADMQTECAAAFQRGYFQPSWGQWWGNRADDCAYDHTHSPNATNVDCVFVTDWLTPRSKYRFAIAARSYHSGGVNAAFLDGSVKAIQSSIDNKIWRALGTHAGNDDSFVD